MELRGPALRGPDTVLFKVRFLSILTCFSLTLGRVGTASKALPCDHDNPPPAGVLPPQIPQDQPTLDPDPNPGDEDEEPNTSNESGDSMGTENPDLLDTQEITIHLRDLQHTVTAI